MPRPLSRWLLAYILVHFIQHILRFLIASKLPYAMLIRQILPSNTLDTVGREVKGEWAHFCKRPPVTQAQSLRRGLIQHALNESVTASQSSGPILHSDRSTLQDLRTSRHTRSTDPFDHSEYAVVKTMRSAKPLSERPDQCEMKRLARHEPLHRPIARDPPRETGHNYLRSSFLCRQQPSVR